MKQLFKKIKNKFFRWYQYIRSSYVQTAKLLLPRCKPMVFLFGVPYHSNMGDHAQTYCLLNWFKKYLPQHRVFITMLTNATPTRLKMIRSSFRKGDILICHSGYHITDMYHERDVYEKVIQLFPEEVVRVMPQTIFFHQQTHAEQCAKVFNSHGRCIMLCRDVCSYKTAQSLFVGCRTHLYPDIVTSLIGVFPVAQLTSREGVLFCMRNDKEAFYSKEQISDVRKLIETHFPTRMSDTTVEMPVRVIARDRQRILAEVFADMAKSRVVVTDRYHGTIFSLVSNTPVIVVNSTDHKLSSGVKWFPESFREHVFFASDLSEVPSLVEQIMHREHPAPLPPYFEEKYYGRKLLRTLDLD